MKQKWLRRMAVPIIVTCAALAGCNPSTTTTPGPTTAYAVLRLTTSGAPDTTFAGGRGIAITDIDPTLFDFALAVAVQPADNKILAAGSTGLAGQGTIAIVRYNTDGTPDTAFGTAGIVRTTLPSLASSAQAIAVQPDGKILVAALTFAAVSGTTATTGIALLRYKNTDGTLDTAFGTGGIVTAAIGSGTTSDTCALALQGDGKIVVAGASPSGDVILYRYDGTGAPDTSGFGTNGTGGKTVTNFATGATSPAMALQADGKIVLAGGQGSFTTPFPVDQVVVRYNTDGTLDTSFNAAGTRPGVVVTDINLLGNFGNAVAIQGDGKIVVAGHANVNFSIDASDISLVRYNADGSLDINFLDPNSNINNNPPGIVTTDLGGFDNALSVALQVDGKIVVSGNIGAAGFTQTAVLRYNPGGSPDTTFGPTQNGNVIVQLAGPSNIASGNAVALQTIGTSVNIVVAGYD
jgi:uncharacterized delta-60 repeat protein